MCPAQRAAHPLFLEFACPDFLCGGSGGLRIVICGFCAFYLFLCGRVLRQHRRAWVLHGATDRAGDSGLQAACKNARLRIQKCPPARPEMPAASGCMPEAARLPPVPARDTPFVFSAVFSALYFQFDCNKAGQCTVIEQQINEEIRVADLNAVFFANKSEIMSKL